MSKKAGTFDTSFSMSGAISLSPFWNQTEFQMCRQNTMRASIGGSVSPPAFIICLRGRFGGCAGREAKEFLTSTPPDFELTSLSQTFGRDRIVEEFVIPFTHTLKMNWMLPGLLATGRKVELGLVGIIQFQ